MKLYQAFLFSLALAISSHTKVEAASHKLDDGFELNMLTEADFQTSITRGLWLVEHFSPRCSHCRAFAPTWEELARKKNHLERLTGFHMAQVDCLAQGDLCNTNGIKFYPQLKLYSDGHEISVFNGERSFSELSKWIEEQSNSYARGQLLASSELEENVVSSGFGRPNPEGKVLEVDERQLEVLKGDGPVLVDFYAPWCGHCKKLRPTYETLAESLKNKLNIAAVNCEEHKIFCKKEQIQGYPTIKMLHRGKSESYFGARNLGGMRKFAMKAVSHLQPIKLEDFNEIASQEDAFFLYLQTFDTAVADLNAVKEELEELQGGIPTYTSSDPLLYQNLSIANPPPTSVLLAFSAPQSFKPISSLAFPSSQDNVRKFINLHKYPTLVQLSASNYNDIMKSNSNATIVLGALHSGDRGLQEKEKLEKIARAWKKGGRRFEQPVWFVWIDAERWASWMKQAYGIKKKELPAAVVIDPPKSEYYDVTIEKDKIEFDGSSIFSVLEGFYQNFLQPKISDPALAWGSRSATMTLISLSEFSFDHPVLAMMTVVGSVSAFLFFLFKCLGKDPRDSQQALSNPYHGVKSKTGSFSNGLSGGYGEKYGYAPSYGGKGGYPLSGGSRLD